MSPELAEARLVELEEYFSRMRPVGSCVWPPGEIPVFRETYAAWQELLAEVRRLRDEVALAHGAADHHADRARLMEGERNEARRQQGAVRSVLNDLLLARQAQEQAWAAMGRQGFDDTDDDCRALYEQWRDADEAVDAAWDRARSLLAGEPAEETLLSRVHERLSGGIDIQTFSDGTVEARWKRLYGDELSDDRFASAGSIPEVLAAILRHEDEVDAADAGEET